MNAQNDINNKNGKTELKAQELEEVRGGEIIHEYEYGPDDDYCRYHCGRFMFKCYDDLNVPMCPANCANYKCWGCTYPE